MQLDDAQVTTREVTGWKGVHLLHFRGSSCSQKVRILLAEKGLAWESHPVDLARQKNTEPWFLGINPRGVVPVLVHDGVVHLESNDIMEHLDALPSSAEPFFPRSEEERRVVKESLDLEDSLHMDLRTITMGFLFPAFLATKSPSTLEAFESGGAPDAKRDAEVAWWRAFAAHGVTREQAIASTAAFRGAFEALEARLTEHAWLIGDRMSVLEIAWFISVHRLFVAGYPLERHPRLHEHYRALLARPAFARETDPGALVGAVLSAYGATRRLRGTTLMDVVGEAA